MKWRDILFAYYRDKYGEYQALRLLELDKRARKERLSFLERQLTPKTDIGQPLWPELKYHQEEMLKLRERAVQAITAKHRTQAQILQLKSKQMDYETTLRDDQSEEALDQHREFAEILALLESLLAERKRLVEELKLVVKNAETAVREFKTTNESILREQPDRHDCR